MKIAITGAAGQLGGQIMARLLADPAVSEIVAIDVRDPRASDARVRFERADVRWPGMPRLLEGCDAVFHLAFLVVGYPPREEMDSVNVKGSRNVFESAAQAGVPTVVYASSVAAYGVVAGHPRPIVETTPRVHQPRFAYSATKYEVEAFLDVFEAEQRWMSIARLRPGILIGRRMDHPLGAGLRRRMVFDTGAAQPLVWDEDVADAAVLAMRKQAKGAYNLVADDPLTWREIGRLTGLVVVPVPPAVRQGAARLVRGLEGVRRPSFDPAWLELGDVPLWFSSEKAKAELGWQPSCPSSIDVMRKYLAETTAEPPSLVRSALRGFGIL